MSIHCSGALSINLLYDKFWLPEKAKFFLYSSDKKHAVGAFTAKNNQGDRADVQGFATGLLYGNKITLEYYLPKGTEETGIISIAYVVHGYRYINIPAEFGTQDLGSSGGCQVNVHCSEGANWQQEKNAVALILVDGNRYCTGSLVNTTCNNNSALLLTADHCLGGWANDDVKYDAITNPNLPHYSFYWQYESPNCTPSAGTFPLATSGATVVANNSISDFALLRLTEDPRNKTGVTPYYLGWDRSGSAGTGGVGIHHPSGDVKKIATYTGTPTTSVCLFSLSNNFWQTGFVATANGHSVMEGGSSGSPLINSNRKVIGQLYGLGNTALCPDYQCDNPSLQQVSYGKFNISWTGGGATDNRRRLDHWLNPGSGTAPNTIDGKVATVISGPDKFCSSQAYTVSNLPSGHTVTGWTADPTYAVTFSGSGNPVTVTRASIFAGQVNLIATVTGPCGPYTVSRKVRAGMPKPDNPMVWHDALSGIIQVSTNAVPGATSYEFYLDGVLVFTTPSTFFNLLPSQYTCGNFYYFSVKAVGDCGTSEEARTFEYIPCLSPFAVFPNPANGSLTISASEGENAAAKSAGNQSAGGFNVKLLNQQGRMLREGISRDGTVSFDTQQLPEGTYYLHIKQGKETVKRQVVIKH